MRKFGRELLMPLSTAVAAEHQIENHLLTAVADPSPIVRQHVATALGRIGSNAVIPALRNLLGDPVPEVRSSAVVSIRANASNHENKTLAR
jgi:HEAT repeat protein